MNKKLYIATVGTGASGEDIAHAIYFSINQQNPDYAVFIVSRKTQDETLPFIEKILKEKIHELKYNVELQEEVNEFETLYDSYLKIIKSYIKQGYQKERMVIDYTSGTKAMSAALVTAGITVEAGSISYTYGERREGGRVKSGSEKVTSLSTNLFNTEKKIYQATTLFNKNLFDAAEEILSSFADNPHPVYEHKIKFINKLSRALSKWDKFDFNSSFEILIEIKSNETLIKEAKLSDINIDKLAQAANFLKEKSLNNYKVLELIENAKRRKQEGKYDDAVARLYRSLEMIGQIEFEGKFNCSSSDVQIENMPAEFTEEIKKYFDIKDNKIKLPLFATFDILKKCDNYLGVKFFDNLNKVKKILHLRNNSILAHGQTPLDEKNFTEALELIQLFANEIKIKMPEFPKLK